MKKYIFLSSTDNIQLYNIQNYKKKGLTTLEDNK